MKIMPIKKLFLLLLPFAVMLLQACSEPQEAPTAPQNEVDVHGAGWMNPSSANFHGKVLAQQNYNSEGCRECHGNQYDGGIVKSSCKACHTTFPHPEGWVSAGNQSFHGKVLAGQNYRLTECAACHGTQFDGGTSGVSCRTCHATYPHAEGWLDPSSATNHGALLAAQNYNAQECQACHGTDLSGGTSGVSCKKCHASYPHPDNFVAGPASHFVFLRDNSYDLNSCKSCHGQDYSVVKESTSCLTCHTQQGGPEACNLCHGNASGDATVLINAAPPEGLDGETSPTEPAVGAHTAHFNFFDFLSTEQVCQECHVVPNNFFAPTHIDGNNRVEPALSGPLANFVTEGGSRVPNGSYDANANTCANTYCHGNWGLRRTQSSNDFIFTADVMTGNSAAPNWVTPGSVACGSCHGLPPTGHVQHEISSCTICHQGVIDAFGRITDKTKHINGKVNVFGMEYPMY